MKKRMRQAESAVGPTLERRDEYAHSESHVEGVESAVFQDSRKLAFGFASESFKRPEVL